MKLYKSTFLLILFQIAAVKTVFSQTKIEYSIFSGLNYNFIPFNQDLDDIRNMQGYDRDIQKYRFRPKFSNPIGLKLRFHNSGKTSYTIRSQFSTIRFETLMYSRPVGNSIMYSLSTELGSKGISIQIIRSLPCWAWVWYSP